MSLFPFWSHRTGSPRTWPEAEQWTDGGPLSLSTYATALYEYGEARIEQAQLHAWMVQRLLIDGGTDHSEAVRITDEVFAAEAPRPCPQRRGRRPEQGAYVHRRSLHRSAR